MRNGGQTLLRIAAGAFVASVIVLAAIEATRGPNEAKQPLRSAVPPADPLTAEMSRCAAIGEAALEDEACRRAWAEHRRRFLGLEPGQPEERP
ncbi:MAG: putative entry exclusion protein TrbK-alt [Labrys sp. (in: a-proteobacteria)]|jgi:conjugative transfer region protein TrbK